MSDIQQARETLAKWRAEALVNGVHRTDLPLIVGTAGNPDLLDAIDGLLETAKHYTPGTFRVRAERIAAAIIAANERMTS